MMWFLRFYKKYYNSLNTVDKIEILIEDNVGELGRSAYRLCEPTEDKILTAKESK